MEGSDAKRIFTEFAKFQAIAPRLMLPTIYGLRWLVWPWDVWRSRRAAAAIRGLLGQMIRPRFDTHRAGLPSDTTDILQSLLDAKDEATGESFSLDELLDQVAMLFLAGHETSASALTWAAYLLANAPEVQERMHNEVMSRIADRHIAIDEESIGNLQGKFTNLCPGSCQRNKKKCRLSVKVSGNGTDLHDDDPAEETRKHSEDEPVSPGKAETKLRQIRGPESNR